MRLSIGERLRVTALAADRSRRTAISRALYSPLLRWRYGSSIADQLLIVPQDLRPRDPSFFHEIEAGQFGLAGSLALLDGASPFDIRPPNEAWARALHGFGWLRHLAAATEPEAVDAARRLAVEWAQRHRGGGGGIAWEPPVIARRMISWISNASLLLEDADPRTYDIITASLGFQLVRLSATWRTAAVGAPRLQSLIAVVLADLTIAGHERQLTDAERALAEELSLQILPDGGHISRNTVVLVDLLLDLLPLSQCFVARNRRPPDAFERALRNGLGMLRFMRLGDGSIARFNGVGTPSPAHVATVLAYDEVTGPPTASSASESGYARLCRGRTVLIADVGPPPPLEFAGTAHAGCLSFEMSVGRHLVFVNGGAPAPSEAELRNRARATVSHNTLCLGEKSSSKLIRHPFLEQVCGAIPIRYPDSTEVIRRGAGHDQDAPAALEASHDGYVRRFGLIHRRYIELSPDGCVLKGRDEIAGASARVRLRRDLPFSIHFHIHPDIAAEPGEADGEVYLEAMDGTQWRFSGKGAEATLEESIHFADSAGARRALQIVLRGATFGETQVEWCLEELVG